MQIEQLQVDVHVDIRKNRTQSLGVTLMSRDINNYSFYLRVLQDGELLVMDDTYEVEVLSLFTTSKTRLLTKGVIKSHYVDWQFDQSYISKSEVVKNYVYVRKNGELLVSADANCFIFNVDLSTIDKDAGRVAEVYDESYESLLYEFEQELEGYKLTLPQASEIRAETDAILNQFSVDSQAKLSLINEAEESRVQAETQRASAESSRVSAESERIQAELERKANEESRELAEDERESAEEQRKTDHANRSAELAGKANKKQEDWITPTLLNGWYASRPSEPPQYMKDEFGFVHFRGTISKGANATSNVAFQLPVGYRPDVITWNTISAIGASRITISLGIFTNGNVDFAGASSDSWYAIGSITFKAV